MIERMERRLEEFAPGFGALVLARAVRSPQWLQDHNPSLVGGDLAGGSFELDQQFVYRPAPELFRGRPRAARRPHSDRQRHSGGAPSRHREGARGCGGPVP
jgi:phytoene dehydrogenase-like protein